MQYEFQYLCLHKFKRNLCEQQSITKVLKYYTITLPINLGVRFKESSEIVHSFQLLRY